MHNAVINASGRAFTDALGIGFAIAATATVVVVGIVDHRLPSHHLAREAEARIAEPAAAAA